MFDSVAGWVLAFANLAELASSGLLSGAAALQRTMPLLAAFDELLPQAAVQRGSVVECDGAAAVSLALALRPRGRREPAPGWGSPAWRKSVWPRRSSWVWLPSGW